ncbi:MAG: hypothetical protein NVSMB2_17360 [Chloroflexota bacterium]
MTATAPLEASTSVFARVDLLRASEAAVARARIQLDPALMADRGWTADHAVRLTTLDERTFLARLLTPSPADAGTGVVRIDRYLRQAMRVRIGGRVAIQSTTPPSVRQLFLLPPLDLLGDHHLSENLRDVLAGDHVVVTVGAPLYLPISASGAGALFRVARVDDEAGVVTSATRLFLNEPDPESLDGQTDVSLEDVGGLDEQLRVIRELVELPLLRPAVYRQLGIQPPRGIILHGPPGTGKTHVCRALANDLDVQFYYVDGPEIVGSMHGETESTLRRLFGEAAHHAPSIICIDEIDSIARARRDLASQTDIRTVTQLLSLMDGLRKIDSIIVIATTNQLDLLDPAFRRSGRFDREVYIGPPNAAGREQILRIHSREMPLHQSALGYLPTLAQNTHGFVGADLVELCREAGLSGLRRTLSPLQIMTPTGVPSVTVADLEHARTLVRPSAGRHTLVAPVPADPVTVIDLDEQYRWLRNLAQTCFEVNAHDVIRNIRGVLLAGPPGCGKSSLVQALAADLKPTFLVVRGPEIFSKWLGNTEEMIRQIFDLAARMPPSIVFFDQIDAVAPVRGSDAGSGTTDRVVSQLLTELDGLASRPRVLVLAATNRPDLVDPSVVRSGRLGLRLDIPLPDERARRAQLSHFSTVAQLALSPFVLDRLVERTAGFAPADVKLLVDVLPLQLRPTPKALTDAQVLTAADEALTRLAVRQAH